MDNEENGPEASTFICIRGCSEGATHKDLEAETEVRFRYLVYLNNRASGERSLKTVDLCDQKTAP